MLALELLANLAVVFIVTLCFQKQPPQVLCKKGVLRKFTKFTGKHLYQSLFFIKVADLRSAPLHNCLCFEHAQISHFTFHISLEVLYDN